MALDNEARSKGGKSPKLEGKRSFSRNPSLASEAGRKGGLEAQKRRREKELQDKSLENKDV